MKGEYKRLTIEQARKEKGLENRTNEEAAEIIDTLEQLSIITFNLWKKENAEKEENSKKKNSYNSAAI